MLASPDDPMYVCFTLTNVILSSIFSRVSTMSTEHISVWLSLILPLPIGMIVITGSGISRQKKQEKNIHK